MTPTRGWQQSTAARMLIGVTTSTPAGSFSTPPLLEGMDAFETWQRIGWHRTTMTYFQSAARELNAWLADGHDVLAFITVLWCAGECAAAARAWAFACARAEVVVLADVEAQCALDAVEGLLEGLGPLTTPRAGG